MQLKKVGNGKTLTWHCPATERAITDGHVFDVAESEVEKYMKTKGLPSRVVIMIDLVEAVDE